MSETDKKSLLLDWLQIALELELATLPPYLVALMSIKRPGNRVAADLIRGVAVEEMLHMALVANVINAVDGQPRIDRDTIPSFPLEMTFKGKAFKDRRFQIDLAPFSRSGIEIFMKIELPQRPPPFFKAFLEEIEIPALTIGEFYMGIVALIEELDAAGGLFTGDPARQLEADYYWSGGGQIIAVHDLASARQALSLVIEQGEAAWPPSAEDFAAVAGERLEMGHYFRVSQIYHEREYVAGDDPGGAPTGQPITVDYGAVYPIRVNAKSGDYPAGSAAAALNLAFNREYTLMLRQIEEGFNGEPRALYTAIMNGMHAVSTLARQLMALPLADHPGENGCPTFEWID
jgi:hypothetical protein